MLATSFLRLATRHVPRLSRCFGVKFTGEGHSAFSRASESILGEEGFVTRSTSGVAHSRPITRYGRVTVNAGQRLGIWSPNGAFRTVDGPRRFFVWGSRIQWLQQHVAGPTEFLRIMKTDGTKEYRYGPCMVWDDPLVHTEVKVFDGITINANESMIIYRERQGEVTRRVARGPAIQRPEDNEWIHKFSWHGRDPSAPATVNRKKPAQLQFTKLVSIPDQMYYDVESVRTSDDAVLTVKIMVFFELVDIEKMLDATSDPPSDIINTLSADIIEWTSSRTFATFKSGSERLNTLEAYPQLIKRAREIGYKITKIVFRGYSTSPKLEGMHDAAIETRTQLTLQQETEAMEQHLADFKLTQAALRADKERKMETQTVEHKHVLDATRRSESLKAEREIADTKQQIQANAATNSLTQAKQAHEEEQRHLNRLVEMGLDLTRYFEAKEQRNVKILKMEGSSAGKRVHLHQHEKE